MSTNLSDKQWNRILDFLWTQPNIRIGNDDKCRTFVEGALWMLRSGAQWRLLPAGFGLWNSVYKRFIRWARFGIFTNMLDHFADDADREWLAFDSTTIRAHICAAGAPACSGGQDAQSLGRSRGGFSTKLHVKVDAHGNPLKNVLSAGQRHDSIGYRQLRDERDKEADAALLDMGYDADWIRQDLAELDTDAVIPSKKSRSQAIPYDKELYKHRHVVECFINKIKRFRRVFSRFDKLDVAYLAFVNFASCLIWLR